MSIFDWSQISLEHSAFGCIKILKNQNFIEFHVRKFVSVSNQQEILPIFGAHLGLRKQFSILQGRSSKTPMEKFAFLF